MEDQLLYEFMQPFDGKLEKWGQQQFSQFGEDTVIWAWVETLRLQDKNGFFVDIGAHHPTRGSNTYLLRKLLEWTGINVEPDPNLFKVFVEEAKDCINLQMAIGKERGTAELTVYNHPGANTISSRLREKQAKDPRIEIVDTITVPMTTINDLLESNLPANKDFRLLTIDAEGLDFEILSGLDSEKYRPNLVAIEDFDFVLSNPENSPIYRLQKDRGYTPVSHCMVTTIYRDAR